MKIATTGESQQKQPTLRFVSYNIQHGEGMDGKINLKRIAEVIAKEKPDLVALQEVDKNCTRSGKRDIAKELGELLNMEFRFGKSMSFQGGEYGNAERKHSQQINRTLKLIFLFFGDFRELPFNTMLLMKGWPLTIAPSRRLSHGSARSQPAARHDREKPMR